MLQVTVIITKPVFWEAEFQVYFDKPNYDSKDLWILFSEYGFSNNNSDLKHEQVSLQVLNVVMLLQDACAGTEETFTQNEIQRMIGILKTNGMKLEPHGPEKGISGVGLYPIYCLLNHSCYSNTNYVKFPDYHLELRSQVPIKRGEEISTRYISATIGMYRKCEV